MLKASRILFKQRKFSTMFNFTRNLNFQYDKILQSTNKTHGIILKSFHTQNEVFEKIPIRRSNDTHSSLNMRAILFKESLLSILKFVHDNYSQMKDEDYIDAIFLINLKLENDLLDRLNFINFDSKPGFTQIKTFINNKFDLFAANDSHSVLLLNFITILNQKSRKNHISKIHEDQIVSKCLKDLDTNHRRMSLTTCLNFMTLLIGKTDLRPALYLKDREEEVKGSAISMIIRFLSRLNNNFKNPPENAAPVIINFLLKDFLNIIKDQKLILKTKAFSVLCKLESNYPFSLIYSIIGQLSSDIRSQAEYHDQNSILFLLDGLVHSDVDKRNEMLKELYDIVTMTITHQPDNIKGDFALEFVRKVSKVNKDTVLTHSHLKILLDSINSRIKSSSLNFEKVPMSKDVIPIFTLMRRHKYYDKELTSEFFEFLYPSLFKLPVESNLQDVKIIINKILGDEISDRLNKEIPERLKLELAKEIDPTLKSVLFNIYRAALFTINNNESYNEEIFDASLMIFDKKLKQFTLNTITFNLIEIYCRNMQNNLPVKFRTQLIEKLINAINIESINDIKGPARFRAFVVTREISIPKDREDLKNKLYAICDKLSDDPFFRKGILLEFVKLSQNKESFLSNNTIYRILGLLKELVSNEEYRSNNHVILQKLIKIAFNFLNNLDSFSSVTTQGVTAILQCADYIHNTYGLVPSFNNNYRFQRMIRTFDTLNLRHFQVLSAACAEYINSDKSRMLNPYSLLIIEKYCELHLEKETISKTVEAYLYSNEKIQLLIESSKPINFKIQLFRLCVILNKKNIFVSDESIIKMKNYMLENFIKNNDYNTNIRLSCISSFAVIKHSVLRFKENQRDYVDIFNFLKGIDLKRYLKFLDRLDETTHLPLISLKFYIEFALKYEKEKIDDSRILMKILDKFTKIRYPNLSFYNKIISDYEQLFKEFSSSDHCDIIIYFSRVELKKEDVIRASARNINLRYLNSSEKLILLNAFIKLGLINQEWRELILEKLIQESDILNNEIHLSWEDKFSLLINLSNYDDWHTNNEKQFDSIIQRINKQKLKKNSHLNSIVLEELIPIIITAPFFSKFNEDLKLWCYDIMKFKRELNLKYYSFYMLIEYLKSMGHIDIEVNPVDKLCDIYIPSTKTPIIFIKKNLSSSSTNNNLEFSSNVKMCVENLNKQGYSPIIVNEFAVWHDKLSKSKNIEIVNFLESLNIPKLITNENYNFTVVDSHRRSYK